MPTRQDGVENRDEVYYTPNCEISFCIVPSFGVNERRLSEAFRVRHEVPRRSPNVREFGFRNPGKFCLWNMKYWALKSEIQLKESGIPLKMESRIEVPLKKKTGIQYLESGIYDLESRIKAVFDRKEKETRFIPKIGNSHPVREG